MFVFGAATGSVVLLVLLHLIESGNPWKKGIYHTYVSNLDLPEKDSTCIKTRPVRFFSAEMSKISFQVFPRPDGNSSKTSQLTFFSQN